MGLDLTVGEPDDQVRETSVVEETSTANQRVRSQRSDGDGDVLPYLELSRFGLSRGVGAITDDQGGWSDVRRLMWVVESRCGGEERGRC